MDEFDRHSSSSLTRRQEVADSLGGLPFTVRTTAALVHKEGRSIQDVAQMYGVTSDRVRQRLRQAGKALGVSSDEEWSSWLKDFGDLL